MQRYTFYIKLQSLTYKISKKNRKFAPKSTKMAILYVFNPEHDLALAANLSNFTSPLAGRKMRHDLGFIPALWAGDDDYVLVDNVDEAETAFNKIKSELGLGPKHFVDRHQLHRLYINKVEPWGWDLALRSFLIRYGVNAVPTEDEISTIRELSHRRQAAKLLNMLDLEGTTGISQEADNIGDIMRLLREYGNIVVKAPWSSSGRGVRFINETIDGYQERWISNIIDKQGSVMVEPCYNNVKDFGMEFDSDGDGNVTYLGLSIFDTRNGAYTGNLIATEEQKLQAMPEELRNKILEVRDRICNILGKEFKGKYKGPFGVDMMVVKVAGELLLHPCVEINLRRTMGHVALAVKPFADGVTRVMQITKKENNMVMLFSL